MPELPDTSSFEYDVFLSHSSKDNTVVHALAEKLRASHLKVWLDAWEILPGDHFSTRIKDGVDKSRILILCMSADAYESDWTTLEHETILHADPLNRKKRFLSILLDDVEIPPRLSQFQHISWRNDDERRDNYDRLLKACTPPGATTAVSAAAKPPATLYPLDLKLENPNFTAREAELAAISTAFEHHACVALTGMPGIGKTATAREYLHRHLTGYERIFWLEAGTAGTGETTDAAIAAAASDATLRSSLGELGRHLTPGLAKDAPLKDAIAAAHAWLSAHTGWIVVLNNADGIDRWDRTLLPPPSRGKTLVTARPVTLDTHFHPIRLQPLDTDSGATCLLLYAGKPSDSPSRPDAAAISATLGGLPLALQLAGALIRQKRMTLPDFHRFLKEKPERFAKLHDPSNRGIDYVAVTFGLAFEALEKRSAAALELLEICLSLNPDSIPESLFTSLQDKPEEAAYALPELLAAAVKDTFDWAEQVREPLLDAGLITYDDETQTFSIHRQTIETLWHRTPEERRYERLDQSARLLNVASPTEEYLWDIRKPLLDHQRACLAAADRLGNRAETDALANLCNHADFYLGEIASYSDALFFSCRALAISETVLGPDHPNTAYNLNNLAELYRTQGDYVSAESLCRRALAIRERGLGVDHPDTAMSLNNLAALYQSQENYAEAESLHRRALAIRERGLGVDHPDTAMSLNNLAALLYYVQRYEEAEVLVRRACTIREVRLGVHPYTAGSFGNLAVILRAMDRSEEADAAAAKAAAIQQAYEKRVSGTPPGEGGAG